MKSMDQNYILKLQNNHHEQFKSIKCEVNSVLFRKLM